MRRASLVIGATLAGLTVLAGLLSLVWTPYDPIGIDPRSALQPPSATHWLGTDQVGSDVFSRLLAGAQICLLVGFVSVAISAAVGVPLGLLAGMLPAVGRFGGALSRLVVRVTDLLYAFPAIILAILLAAVLGGSTWTGLIAIGVSSVPVFTRITRAGVMQVMSQDHIMAARVSGIGWFTIARRHVLPNVAPLLGVQASVSFAMAILAEAALSYLGLATPPPTPTWGHMLFDARVLLFSHPSLALWPAGAIAVAVLGFNLLGDGLRDLLDPRLKEVR